MRITSTVYRLSLRVLTGILCLLIINAHGQQDALVEESVAVSARPSPDSIVLRWAPLDLQSWHLGNESGYRIERYTLSRRDVILAVPELAIVQHAIRPLPESEWERLVIRDPYAAIAAQALFGDRFEVDLQQSDVFTIVNKVRENEQRFAFALFSADMSPTVARASGLWFSDYDIRQNEKYLYRIVLNASDSLRGSIFISPADPYELPKPANLSATFNDRLASLKWENAKFIQYTAYLIERSADGRNFKRISESPLMTVSPTEISDTRYAYAVDSLPDISQVYHYRVRGITPFGETGPPSDVVKGKGTPAVSQVPYIHSAISTDNATIDLQWEFPSENERAIKGFDVERAARPTGKFESLTNVLLNTQRRSFTDISPGQSNYYRVIAYGQDGDLYSSHVYYAQLVDSIPPSPPTGLLAQVDDDGEIILTWDPNSEEDVYGYRVYKAYHMSEELAQLTTAPLNGSSISDRVNLNTLNEHVYYSVMAIDQNQNHSSLSPVLKVSLPDKVKPQPPVTLPLKSDASGISVSWRPGGSRDVIEYKVFRRTPIDETWQQIYAVVANDDSLYVFSDKTAHVGVKYVYTILSIDDAGLESEPASPVVGAVPVNILKRAPEFKKPGINREENALTLMWDEPDGSVDAFRIFRSVGNKPMVAYKTIKGDEAQFLDAIIPGRTYRYRVLAIFANGQQSALSKEIEVDY